jgi:hypothetical protein
MLQNDRETPIWRKIMFLLLIKKIGLYLGIFYLSFLAALVIAWITKQKKSLITLSLLVSILIALNSFTKNIINLKNDLTILLTNKSQESRYIDYQQTNFLNNIKYLFKDNQLICYPWPSDIAGRFAQQFLYPKKLDLSSNLDNCRYLVLDYTSGYKNYFNDKELTEFKLVFLNQAGKVYVKNDN